MATYKSCVTALFLSLLLCLSSQVGVSEAKRSTRQFIYSSTHINITYTYFQLFELLHKLFYIKRCAPTMMLISFFWIVVTTKSSDTRCARNPPSKFQSQNSKHIHLVRIYCLYTIMIQFINVKMIQIFRALLTH